MEEKKVVYYLIRDRVIAKREPGGLTCDCWDQGFMETIQSDIEKDLKAYGATDIYSFGFLD